MKIESHYEMSALRERLLRFMQKKKLRICEFSRMANVPDYTYRHFCLEGANLHGEYALRIFKMLEEHDK